MFSLAADRDGTDRHSKVRDVYTATRYQKTRDIPQEPYMEWIISLLIFDEREKSLVTMKNILVLLL